LTEGLSRQLFQTYLSCRSWCASSPKDPVIATSPAYHGHPPQRLLLNSPDTTSSNVCPPPSILTHPFRACRHRRWPPPPLTPHHSGSRPINSPHYLRTLSS